MDSRRFVFLWRIENFSMLPHKNNEEFDSSAFKVGFLDNTEWKLQLYPRGYSGYKDNLSLYLYRIDNGNSEIVKIGFSLTVKSIHSEFNIIKKEECHEFVSSGSHNHWGWHAFKLLKEIHDSQNGYLPQNVLTLECQMWFPENEPMNEISGRKYDFSEKCACTSRINVDKRCVTWPIMRIKELIKCKSADFVNAESSIKDAPAFKILFSFSEDADCQYAKINITQTKSFSSSISHFVKCKITIVTAHKEHQHSKEDTFLFSSDNKEEVWNFPDFIEIENLSNDRYVNLDNVLYLICEFSFTTENEVAHAEIPTYSQEIFQKVINSLLHSSHMTSSILKLYQSQKMCDVNLQVGDQSFPAQKIIICAQSPVFYAMFERDMKEKNTNVVQIEDVEPDTLKLMLEFLHSNAMKEGLSIEEIFKLYSAADKYQIVPLKQECAIMLLSLMSTENVCEVLVVADRHNDNFLLTFVKNFLKMNTVGVFQSPQWKEFQNEDPKLFGNVMIDVLQDS